LAETHWHEWTPSKFHSHWKFEGQGWTHCHQTVNHRITHNGDFEAWTLFDQEIDFTSLGLWLERVLHQPNQTRGDSPKIAGMMDFLITQGQWFASVRWAYQKTLVHDIGAAFGGDTPSKTAPNTAPTEQELFRWASVFEAAFTRFTRTRQDPVHNAVLELVKQILPHFYDDSTLQGYSCDQLHEFCMQTFQSFFENSVFRATQEFLSRAKGSFGLVVISTLEPESIVVSALRQPIIVGFNPGARYSVYASEPAAVDAAIMTDPNTYRLSLNQVEGEIAVLNSTHAHVYNLHQECFLSEESLQQRYYRYSSKHLGTSASMTSQDPIERDLHDIPQVLHQIQNSWENSYSSNRQAAEHLLNFLIAKTQARSGSYGQSVESRPRFSTLTQQIDLLILGVENSLWVGERFAEDLQMIFPGLVIRAMSSNQFLQEVQYDLERLGLSCESIVFAITQSGQTFPTCQSLYICETLIQQHKLLEFFILTGQPGSFIGTSLAQSVFPGESCSRRIFDNHSGRRSAEAASCSVVATHHTLTQLLLYLTTQMHRVFPEASLLEIRLSRSDLQILRQIETGLLYQDCFTILGQSYGQKDQVYTLYRHLVRSAKKWAFNIIECPLAWFIHTLYIFLSIGWSIPFETTIPVVRTSFNLILGGASIQLPPTLEFWLNPCITLADITVYIFGSWFLTLGLRLIQGRSLWARTGKRTLVIGDIRWVHQVLSSFVSKLFALSYGIASVDVQSADPQDHLLHGFSHRVTRGTLLFLGIPDGRCSSMQQNHESSVLMTAKQAYGIQNFGHGPEITVVSSNPNVQSQEFSHSIILPSLSHTHCHYTGASPFYNQYVEMIYESRYGSLKRLLASYVFFWAFAKSVASLPFLKYEFWKSQSRTKIMTTAAPVAVDYRNLSADSSENFHRRTIGDRNHDMMPHKMCRSINKE
ncbi:MAG: hypothetical protein HC810_08480, partial [Acaryochloridaceae cyanobacterium RL_2_7]|nr:hypothetical protein [Acaryochloridaceae cyanobacterium RL_2_7]